MTELAMQAEEHSKAVVREYVEAFNRGDRLQELLADDAEIQGVKGKGTFEKVEPVWRQLIDGYGIQLKIEGLIAEGNTVAVRYLESGTFRAPAFGSQPTGRSYELVAKEWFEIESGRIKSLGSQGRRSTSETTWDCAGLASLIGGCGESVARGPQVQM